MAATSPSTAHPHGRIDQHPMAMAETDDERTDSPCDVTSSESLHDSRPRRGVGTGTGTGTSSGLDIDVHTSTDLSHGTQEEYALPSMGYGFPSKRVSCMAASKILLEANCSSVDNTSIAVNISASR
jgi:hypothetical protein